VRLARLRCVALAAAFVVFSSFAGAVRAQDIGVFQLFLNLQPKGDVFVRQEAVGDYWIKVADLRAAGMPQPIGETRVLGGELHLRLSSLQDVLIDVDSSELTISINAKPDALGRQAFNLSTKRELKVTVPPASNARYNYRVGYEQAQGLDSSHTYESQIAAWSRGWLFQYRDSYASDLAEHNYVRLSTNLVYDWVERMQRLNIGDITTLSGELGTTRTLGGVGFSRVFDTQPGFVSNPTASFIGTVGLPSTAEIYVDGVRVGAQRLNPGTFQFNNLDYYGGLRNTEIVIRDPYGGRQVLSRSVYFTDQLLRRGLQDYSYNIGVERENVGTTSSDYAGRAFSFYHRYGVDDSLTLGLRGDGNSEAYSWGPIAGVRAGSYGILSGSLSTRHNAALDERGNAWVVRHAFESRRWSTRAQLRRQDRAYSVSTGDPTSLALPHQDALLGVGYTTVEWGRISFDMTRANSYDGTFRNANTFGYSVRVRRAIQFFTSLSHVAQSTGNGWEGFVGGSISWEGRHNANLTRQSVIGAGNIDTAEISKSAPEGEGNGYRMSLVRTEDGTVFEPFAQLNTRYWIFTADASMKAEGTPPAPDRVGVSAAGAIVFAGGEAGMTRPIHSSFAVVKVGDLDGVRVYRNNQQVGRTDADGVLVVPNITSYAYNALSIEQQDVPLGYSIPSLSETVVPPLGSGVLARFDVRRIRAFEGKLRALLPEGEVALEHVVISLHAGAQALMFTTGYGGEFYLDGVEPGDYEASFETASGSCGFRLALPATGEVLAKLDTITVRCVPSSPR